MTTKNSTVYHFFSILIASFLSVVCALFVWHYIEKEINIKEHEKLQQFKKIVGEVSEAQKEDWIIKTSENYVTKAKTAIATRFSREKDAFITFRCYDKKEDNSGIFDLIIGFPRDIEWVYNSKRDDHFSLLSYVINRNAEKELSSKIPVSKLSGSVAILGPCSYHGPYSNERVNTRLEISFSLAESLDVSVLDGTIHEQTSSFDLTNMQEKIRPVLDLCNLDTIEFNNEETED